MQRTALDAIAAGYLVHVAVDACGGANECTEDATWRRIVEAGGITTSVTSVAAELAGYYTTDVAVAQHPALSRIGTDLTMLARTLYTQPMYSTVRSPKWSAGCCLFACCRLPRSAPGSRAECSIRRE